VSVTGYAAYTDRHFYHDNGAAPAGLYKLIARADRSNWKTPEKNYYEPIRKEFEKLLSSKGTAHLEITANKVYGNKIKAEIPDDRDLIFNFLREAPPDILGFVKSDIGGINLSTDFVVIEVKDEILKLDHIYQARKYAELFHAEHTFLVSTREIPEELKRLSKVVTSLLDLPKNKLILSQFDTVNNKVVTWYEENPFDSSDWFL